MIHRIRRTNGEWVDDEASICTEAVSFFQELFTEEVGNTSNDMLEVIPRVITDHDNIVLTEVPLLHEVKEVIFSMDRDRRAQMASRGSFSRLRGRWSLKMSIEL